MEMKRIYSEISRHLDAYKRCPETVEGEKHIKAIKELLQEMPNGSGLNEWSIDVEKSNDKGLVFYNSYDTMNEYGFYEERIDFTLRVFPSLMFGVDIKITGKFGSKKRDIKESLYEMLI